MLNNQTMEKLLALRLEGMAQALEEQRRQADISQLDFEERLALLLPFSAIAEELPAFALSADVAFFLRKGQPVFAPNAPVAGLLRLFTREGVFLGVGEATDDGMIAPRRLVKEPVK